MSRRAHERKERPAFRPEVGQSVRVACEPPIYGAVERVRGAEALVAWQGGSDWFSLRDVRGAPPPPRHPRSEEQHP